MIIIMYALLCIAKQQSPYEHDMIIFIIIVYTVKN